jgi:aerobactin synthase
MIAELSYEELLRPAPHGDRWRLEVPGDWTFAACRSTFGALRVDAESILRDGEPADDPVRFAADIRPVLGWPGPVFAELVRDLIATQSADVRLRSRAVPAAELAALSHEDIESHQSGHPCLVLNKGRLGFSAADADLYTPEAAGAFRLVWVAVSPSLGQAHGLPQRELLPSELDGAFAGAVPESYHWLPVHPFQWHEVVRPLFGPQLASGQLVWLGESPDEYRPLQSVRTLTNLGRPDRRNVKVSLMIRNTLVWRGLSSTEAGCAPYVTAWLQGLCGGDQYLRQECRVVMLGEVASVTVPHPAFAPVSDLPYRYQELLGAIWREPVHAYLEPGERARTMACLLSFGSDGRSLAAELVARSGLPARPWLASYLKALLRPVLHYLYRYGVCFTPHGENVVLIFDDREVPVRIALKDFGADVELLTSDLPEYARLPPGVFAQLHRWSAGELAHSVLSAICAGVFRFFAPIVSGHLGVPEPEFWGMVRAEIVGYHERFGITDDPFGLLEPTFGRVSLNREQFLGGGFHDRAERDGEFDVIDGVVDNPLYVRGPW